MRFVTLVLACLAGTASADVIIVPDDYAKIKEAINAATAGDEIHVRAGTYYENEISPNGKKISIIGELSNDGDLLTTIDGYAAGSVIICEDEETPATIFSNLIIANGKGSWHSGHSFGGGLLNMNDSHATFTNCLFTSNEAEYGAGIICLSGSPDFSDCEIIGNSAIIEGGGLYVASGQPVLSGCWICDNTPEQIVGNYQESGLNCIQNECKDSDDDGVPDCLDPCPHWTGTCVDGISIMEVAPGESIQAAIDASPPGGLVQLEEGIYEEGNLTTNGKAITIDGVPPTMEKGIAYEICYGYYVGSMIEPPPGEVAFLIQDGEGEDTVLQELVLIGDGSQVEASSPTFKSVVFTAYGIGDNFESAIHCHGEGSPVFEDCIFYTYMGNIWDEGIKNSDGVTTRIESCTFWSGDAFFYRGISNSNCSVTINNCDINGMGTAIYNYGSNSTINNCDLSSNNNTGAVNYYGAPVFIGCNLSGNNDPNVQWGTGVWNEGTKASFVNCDLSSNTGGYNGYGALNFSSEVTFLGCRMKNNGTSDYYQVEDLVSGAIINTNSTSYVIATEISGNEAYLCPTASIDSDADSLAIISYSKICSNDLNPINGTYTEAAGNCITTNCSDLVDDADADGVPDCMDQCPGIPDVDTDEDGIADCHDQCPDAPDLDMDRDGVADCVDVCPGFDDTLDSDGDGTPDGCETCEGDLDGSGSVGIADLLIVIDLWGTPGGDCDGDGDTDIEDLLVLIGNWDSCN
ncbi:MAG: hypothetical protein CMJ39_04955 [Phycisphaerae bacterium]|nr:hypothetical protein [Phycisphaerae bacterium]